MLYKRTVHLKKRRKKKWISIPPEKDVPVFAFTVSPQEKENPWVIPVTLGTFRDYLKW